MLNLNSELVREFLARLGERHSLPAQLYLIGGLDVEAVPLDQFIPLPDGAQERIRLIDIFGAITVSVFDPYSIALSKLARGFDTDIEDIVFLIQRNFIAVDELEAITVKALLRGREFDIIPGEVRQNFQAVYRRLARVT